MLQFLTSISIQNRFIKFLLLVGLTMLFMPIKMMSQNSKLHYKIKFNGEEIGWLQLEKNIIGNRQNLFLTSEIKTKIVFAFDVITNENSTFENGKLVYSFQIRKINGNVKTNRQLKLVNDAYEVFEDGEMQKLSYPFINNNLLSLYFQEPKTINSVYLDKNQSFIKVTKKDDGGYQTKFSNGNSNCFYYKDGVCTRVKIEHLFYSAEIIFSH